MRYLVAAIVITLALTAGYCLGKADGGVLAYHEKKAMITQCARSCQGRDAVIARTGRQFLCTCSAAKPGPASHDLLTAL